MAARSSRRCSSRTSAYPRSPRCWSSWVDPWMSVKRKVTVPVGRPAMNRSPPPRIEVRHRPRVRVNVRRITSPLLGCWPSVGPKISLVFTLLLGVLPAFGEARERVGQDRADRRGRRCRGARPGPRPTIRPRCRMLLLCTPADKIESWVRSAQPSTSGIPEVQRWETIEALVDTGAGYTWIPASTLARLGVSPQSRREFVTADGRIIDGIWL